MPLAEYPWIPMITMRHVTPSESKDIISLTGSQNIPPEVKENHDQKRLGGDMLVPMRVSYHHIP